MLNTVAVRRGVIDDIFEGVDRNPRSARRSKCTPGRVRITTPPDFPQPFPRPTPGPARRIRVANDGKRAASNDARVKEVTTRFIAEAAKDNVSVRTCVCGDFDHAS